MPFHLSPTSRQPVPVRAVVAGLALLAALGACNSADGFYAPPECTPTTPLPTTPGDTTVVDSAKTPPALPGTNPCTPTEA